MSDHQTFHIDHPFRGARTYVHSASIGADWAARAPKATRFELVLKRMMANRLIYSLSTPKDAAQGCGFVRVTHENGVELWRIDVDPAHPVTERVPYDEDAIPVEVDHGARTAQIPPCKGTSWFDRLIRGNKALINEVLSPGVTLIAAKIVVEGVYPDDAPLSLSLKSHVGTRIFKSTIQMDGTPVGEVVYYGE